MRSGDQNCTVPHSIRNCLKPQKHQSQFENTFKCRTSHLNRLFQTCGTPRWRKRGEKGEVVETIEDVIVRRLTTERIEELKKLLRDTQEQYRKLKKEVELIHAGHMDSQLKELWSDITLKKKQDEEEAEQKRKATEMAYQARQAVKNTPKRLPSVTVRSPLGASPSAMDSQSDSSLSTPSMETGGISSDDTNTRSAQGIGVFLPAADPPGSGPKDGGLAALVDDSPQKRLLTQKATPPPSPLLSELLKKGNLISASPRLVRNSRISKKLIFFFLNDSNGVALSGGRRRLHWKFSQRRAGGHSKPRPTSPVLLNGSGGEADAAGKEDLTEETGLVEEDLVAVSYMGDELDLETVGDIIAIIEEKVDDSVEALDAAAVEAALSLCEEAVSEGHSLPGPWETQELKHSEPQLAVQDAVSAQEPQDSVSMTAPSPAGVETHGQPDVKKEEPFTGNGEGSEVTGVAIVSDGGAAGSEVTEEAAAVKEATEAAVKSDGEDWSQPEPNPPCLDSEDSCVSGKESKEVKEEEDAGSEGDPEDEMEMKEDCGEGEGPYLSEVEPAASESEDGYGPPSQRYTADSLASSPASSSQLSTCGEDQEAVQAQKIWKKAIMLVWRAAANHRYASVFLQPVSDDIAPGYHSIVHRPMDLSAIKKNIESGVIRTTAEFQRDIMLMFQNAIMYNSSDHDVYHMALEMQRDVLEHVQQFLATQLIMQTSESAISAKSLRGREGNRKPGEPAEKVLYPLRRLTDLGFKDTYHKDIGTRGRRSAMEADLKMKK
uniref:Bromodomain-containing protein 8 n=1 Tax=Oryzias latipes TaxID=8090 RepID=A0A3P9LBU2_ORYLA